MSSSASKKQSRKNAPGARLDPGWDHGIEIDANKKQVQCKYCRITRAGGVYRLKHYLDCTHTNVEPCPSVPETFCPSKSAKVYLQLAPSGFSHLAFSLPL